MISTVMSMVGAISYGFISNKLLTRDFGEICCSQ